MTTSNDELVRELRDFAIRYGGIPRREIEAIISRHSVAKPQEPLAELANKCGYFITHIDSDGVDGFTIIIKAHVPKDDEPRFDGSTYAEAESKARAYLSSLPDQNKGDK